MPEPRRPPPSRPTVDLNFGSMPSKPGPPRLKLKLNTVIPPNQPAPTLQAYTGYAESAPLSEHEQQLRSLRDLMASSASSEPAPTPNYDSADFDFVARLGEGASGAVDRVVHRPTGTVMARKSITTISSSTDIHKQIMREVSFLQKCQSPAIVNYFGAYLADNGAEIMVLMELCGGGSLDSVYKQVKLRGGVIGEKILANIADSILTGLEYLHGRKIIHRDIKPSNVVLTRSGQVKLCDLGVSGELVNSIAQTFAGTSFYMAPERMQNQSYGIASDVWSTGLTLMEVAMNRYPIAAELPGHSLSPFELLSAIMFKPLRLPEEEGSQWTKAFRHFLELCLERDPTLRLSPARMLEHPWIVRSRNRVPQPDMGKWLAEVWGWTGQQEFNAADGMFSPTEGNSRTIKA